jgi:hypothetical protein
VEQIINMRNIAVVALIWTTFASLAIAWSPSMRGDGQSRRTFVTSTVTSAILGVVTLRKTDPGVAASPEIFKTLNGIKYAVTRQPEDPKSAAAPRDGDIVAIEYTGYLTDGEIFDATHAEGKRNALLFKLGSTAVIPGINELLTEMVVGQKVQAIIPPSLAFGDKGLCIDDGECLIKPGSTLVYDVFLKKSTIPPP